MGILYWIYPTCRWGGVNPVLSFFALGGLAAHWGLFWLLFGASVWFYSRRPLWEYPFWAAAAWTVLEWLRGTLFSGFPWLPLSCSQWQVPKHLPLAEWGGGYAVSFMILLFNGAVAVILKGLVGKEKQAWAGVPSLITLAGLTACSVFLWRKPIAMAGPPITVAVIQGNIDQYKKWDAAYEAEIVQTYSTMTGNVQSGDGVRSQGPAIFSGDPVNNKSLPAEKTPGTAPGANTAPNLILWPETAVPGWVPNDEKYTRWIQGLAKRVQTPLLTGAVTRQENRDYNAAFLLSETGQFLGHYRKNHLVPFGEYVPLRSVLAPFVKVLNELGTFDRGREATVFPISGARWGVTICFEGLFPRLVARFTREGAQILVNITNDGWYRHTAAPEQHFSASVVRAVENRRWVVRAANTGYSGFISPRGEVVARTKLMEPAVLLGHPEPTEVQTFYVRHGDVFILFLGLLMLGGMILERWPHRTPQT